MMRDPEGLIQGVRGGILLTAGVALVVGALSVLAPRRSIALYQWIMAQCNWRVTPIDAQREVLTTRALGAALVLLSAWTFWLTAGR